MNQLKTHFILLCCLLSISTVLNAEIYKWVDEKGKVHYSDKPIDDKAQKITINKGPSEKQKKAAQLNANKLIEREKRIRQNQIEDQQDLQKQKVEKHKIDKLCLDAKKELEILMTPVRVFHKDQTGKDVYLSDENRKKEIELYRNTIKDHCSD